MATTWNFVVMPQSTENENVPPPTLLALPTSKPILKKKVIRPTWVALQMNNMATTYYKQPF